MSLKLSKIRNELKECSVGAKNFEDMVDRMASYVIENFRRRKKDQLEISAAKKKKKKARVDYYD